MKPIYPRYVLSLFIVYVVVIIATTNATPLVPTEEFTHHAFLDEFGLYKLYWKFNQEKITFEVHVKTTGYVGFGFSPNGGMPGSDIVIGWVTNNGKTRFTDRHASHYGEPRIDEKQDYILLYGREEDEYTILKFERKLDTCDDGQDRIITSDTMRLIWAYHPDKPEDGQPLPWHGRERRGGRSMYLMSVSPDLFPSLEEENANVIELLNENVSVPWRQDTTYYCKGFAIPRLNGKHHMIMYEPVIQHGNEALVHHIVVYMCHGGLNESYHGTEGECRTPNMPPAFDNCITTIIAWAVGGGPFFFPDAAGFSLGDDGDPTFVMMETHYDNPEYKSTFIDSSGIRIYYTSKLREFDATMLLIGHLVQSIQIIPPGMRKFTTKSYCSGACTRNALADHSTNETTDLHMFAGFLHSHLAGRAIRLRHIRDGIELPNIIKDDYYDFNYQELHQLTPEVILKAGDSLMVECDYETMGKSSPVYGGLGTNDEMCLVFMYAYPRSAFTVCVSSLAPTTIAEAVNVEINPDNYRIRAPEQHANKSMFEYLDYMNWTDEIKLDFQAKYDNGLMFEYCPPTKFTANSYFIPTPIRETLPDYNRQCDLEDNNDDGPADGAVGIVVNMFSRVLTLIIVYIWSM
ncbi:DBH-like monooxygenase protein 1 homolog [Saccoglossus kowalevskii]|uniref:DBH-like monooxygenase protein 1 homolog n=1 Tax=Saccoglossus kowalevskii TaxID=10224 RepID=A0ABM0GQB5_SACKO|nr:PREDICTED: DBH-like monooxygenase protein 1 homolog [Saccoglossus kowalevskii]